MNRPKTEEIARMLSPDRLADLLDVPLNTLASWRKNWDTHRRGPRWTKIGPSEQSPVRYRLEDVIEWQKSLFVVESSAAERIEAEYDRQKTA